MSADGFDAPLRPPMPPLASDDIGGLGVLTTLRRNALSAFPARCLDEPVVQMRMPGRRLVVACGAEAAKQVLQTCAEDYGRVPAGRRVLGPIVGRGLLVSEGEAWRRQRRAMAPAFTPRTLPMMAGHVMQVADAAVARLEASAGAPVDLLEAMQRLSLDIAATTMFSLEASDFGPQLRAMITRYMTALGRPAPEDFLLPAWAPTPLALRRVLFRRRWRRLMDEIVARRRRDPRSGQPRDLFDLMAEAHGEGADDLLVDEVATMLVAGHETTALTLFWALLLLAQSPAWRRAVMEEAQGLDLSPERAAEALPRLARARAVVQETLRLYSPAFMTARLSSRPTRICGEEVSAGALVLVPFWLMHRDPRRWERPDVFDPGRFLSGAEPDRFSYLPFGLGPHVCIGAQLAMTEAVLVIARLAQRFNVMLTSADRPVLPVALLSTRPDHAPSFAVTPL
jgi:cytochrome P450